MFPKGGSNSQDMRQPYNEKELGGGVERGGGGVNQAAEEFEPSKDRVAGFRNTCAMDLGRNSVSHRCVCVCCEGDCVLRVCVGERK